MDKNADYTMTLGEKEKPETIQLLVQEKKIAGNMYSRATQCWKCQRYK
jgi:hypothetical protein